MGQPCEVIMTARNKLRSEVKGKVKGRERCYQSGRIDPNNAQFQLEPQGAEIGLVMKVIGAEEA